MFKINYKDSQSEVNSVFYLNYQQGKETNRTLKDVKNIAKTKNTSIPATGQMKTVGK